MADNAITTKSIPQPGAGVVTGNPGGVLVADEVIEAMPLVGPTFTEVKSKNPNLQFRYVLRNDPNKTDGSRIRYNECLAMGFAPALANIDCVVPGLSPVDGHYIYGDLILMKIDRKRYEGAKLHNEIISRKRAAVPNIAAATRAELPRTDKITLMPTSEVEKHFSDVEEQGLGQTLPLVPKKG